MTENSRKEGLSRSKVEPVSEKKWGNDVIELGYSIVPSLIFKAQRRLGLNSVELNLLLHLMDFWWGHNQMPFPSKTTLAERVNLSPRQLQRYLTALEEAGFIQREARYAGHKGQQSNRYNLNGLVNKLKKLAPEFREVKEDAKKKTKKVEQPGGLGGISGGDDYLTV